MKIGILGHGSIGARHAKNLRTLGHQVGVYDPDYEGTMDRATVIKWADAIVIASPSSEHEGDIRACKKEKKPCFCEKPISLGPTINSILKYPVMVGYNLRFHPSVIKAREWLKDERIGTPLWSNFLCAQYNNKPAYKRDGVTLNWSHEIDLALHLLGPAKMAAASITKDDDIADIILVQGGCRTSVHLDYVTNPEHRGFNIVGDKGTIIVNIPRRNIVLLSSDGTVKQGEEYTGSIDGDYEIEIEAFIDRCGGGDVLGCTAEEAIEVLKIGLAAKAEGQDG